MVPHSIVTVSLATAILPRLFGAGRGRATSPGCPGRWPATLRTALAVIVPFAALLPVIADDIANVIWGYGAGAEDYDRYVPTSSLFGAGLVFFTVHYLVLRGFYALEQTRTVFWIQCAVAATNIAVAVAGRRPHRRGGHLPSAGARLHRGVRRRLGCCPTPSSGPGSAGSAPPSSSGSWRGWRSRSPRRPPWRWPWRWRCTP